MNSEFVHVSYGGISECQQCQLSVSYASPEEPSDNGKVVFKGDEMIYFLLSLLCSLTLHTLKNRHRH